MLRADELELGCAGEPAVLALAIARDVQEADQPLACTVALLNYLREKGQIAGLHVKAEMNSSFREVPLSCGSQPGARALMSSRSQKSPVGA